MLKDTFDDLWEKVVVRMINELAKEYKGKYYDMPLIKKEYYAWQGNQRDKIFKVYEEKKKELKETVFCEGERIDRHKIASILVLAVLEIRPFKIKKNFENKDLVPWRGLNANFILALHLASNVIRSFIVSGTTDKKEKEVFRKEFTFCGTEYGTYEENFYCMLSSIGQHPKLAFNVLKLSKIFFHIEHETRRSEGLDIPPPTSPKY